MSGNVFIAVDLDTEERHALAAALQEASPGPVIPGRRVPPENWHVTLRFVGDVEELAIERLARELDEHLDPAVGAVTCSGLGAFPNPRKATVVYASIVDTDGVLAHLAAECEQACRAIGLEPEGRRFVPHVTIARVRPPVDVRRLIDRFGDFSVRLAVDEVRIMRSILGKGRVRYEVLEAVPLDVGGR